MSALGHLRTFASQKGLSALAKLDRVLLLVVAGRALERAHVVAILVAGIDAGEGPSGVRRQGIDAPQPGARSNNCRCSDAA